MKDDIEARERQMERRRAKERERKKGVARVKKLKGKKEWVRRPQKN